MKEVSGEIKGEIFNRIVRKIYFPSEHDEFEALDNAGNWDFDFMTMHVSDVEEVTLDNLLSTRKLE